MYKVFLIMTTNVIYERISYPSLQDPLNQPFEFHLDDEQCKGNNHTRRKDYKHPRHAVEFYLHTVYGVLNLYCSRTF